MCNLLHLGGSTQVRENKAYPDPPGSNPMPSSNLRLSTQPCELIEEVYDTKKTIARNTMDNGISPHAIAAAI